jgi:integral membrane protein
VKNSTPLLKAYRALAYITGVGLVLLCISCIVWYGFGVAPASVMIVGTIHGWAYMAYVVVAFSLGMKLKWPLKKLILILLAGTIPTCSFFAERRVMRDAAVELAARDARDDELDDEPVRI